MAPRTGVDRLIAPLAKTTSTRSCLVLVVAAALLAGGCGGGSGEDTKSASSQTSAQVGQGGGSSTSEQGGGSGGSKEGTGSGVQGEGGKQGTPVTPPKGPREKAPTQKQRAEATVASIALKSPSLRTGTDGVFTLPATYTCDGDNSWPALEWSGVPEGTVELALTVVPIEPVNGELFFDWALAGIDPSLEGIEAGRLPKGAVVGENSSGEVGYSVCPPPGKPETIVFTLYALPSALEASRGFDPAAMREEILDRSGDAGIFAATYIRR